MKFVVFSVDGRSHVGVHSDDDNVLSLSGQAGESRPLNSMLQLIQEGEHGLSWAREQLQNPQSRNRYRISDIIFEAPISEPPRLRDCSLFIEHLEPAFRGLASQIAESAADPGAEFERLIATGDFDRPAVFETEVIYYNADRMSISGPGKTITAPVDCERLDYELEFAAVLGRTAKNVSVADATEMIFGLTIFNDWSVRNVQSVVMESRLGPARAKDFDNSNTLGPCIVTPDEFTDIYDLELEAYVNGELWSSGNSSRMHHSFEDAIAYLSRDRAVYAGEVLGSGTILHGSPIEIGRRLKDGDVVELRVEGIGSLTNTVQMSSDMREDE